ncbi:hypothetical protein AAG906_031202 [Vitis piasezkii]
MQIVNPDFATWPCFNRMLSQIVSHSTALEIGNALNQIYFVASMAREPVSYTNHLLYLFGVLDRTYNLYMVCCLFMSSGLDSQNSDDQLSSLQANLSQLNLIKNLSNLILHTLDWIMAHTISSSKDTLIVASTKSAHHHPSQYIPFYLPALKPSLFKPKIPISDIGIWGIQL